MTPVQEQFTAVARAGIESQVAFFNAWTSTTLQSMQKLATLNLTAARASIDEFAATMHQVLGMKTPQELSALLAAQTKPSIEKALAYSGHISNIASGAQAEYAKAAEQQVSEAGRHATQLISDAGGKLPVRVEDMVSFIRARFGNESPTSRLYSAATVPASEPIPTPVAASVAPTAEPIQKKGDAAG